jgi:hypothetical protein
VKDVFLGPVKVAVLKATGMNESKNKSQIGTYAELESLGNSITSASPSAASTVLAAAFRLAFCRRDSRYSGVTGPPFESESESEERTVNDFR